MQQQRSPVELNADSVDTKPAGKQKWTRVGETENLILTDVDKDKTLCASLTGRDNIPKLEKSLGTDRQKHVLSNSKDKRLKTWQDLPHWDNWATDTGSVVAGGKAVLVLRRPHSKNLADCEGRRPNTLVYMEYWFNVN